MLGKLTRLRNGFWVAFGETLPFPLARTAQLRHRHRLVELSDGAENLPHQNSGRGIVDERVRLVGSDQGDAISLQATESGFLHDEIASEAVRSLDNDGPDAVAGTLFKRGGKARPDIDRIGTGDGWVRRRAL